MQLTTDVLIIGAGAAGLMCSIQAAKRGRRVTVIDHANRAGKKILMSGGGRCNFTNIDTSPDQFISHNPHFCRSALSRYTPSDFIALVEEYKIPYHEKTKGQLFCTNKSKDILNMLLAEAEKHSVNILLNTTLNKISKTKSDAIDNPFVVATCKEKITAQSVVIATGGLSIPSMGASPLGYKIADQFGIKVWPTRAGLVPFTLHPHDKKMSEHLSGVSLDCQVQCGKTSFKDPMLFTHRGLSGPAMLQVSSYWKPGDNLVINTLPTLDAATYLKEYQLKHAPLAKKIKVIQALKEMLPQRFILEKLKEDAHINLASCNDHTLKSIAEKLQNWSVKPNATEGYRTAEVTLGGVDCDAISSKTFEANNTPGLYFIGEVLDVTGWLGGYNFQWAWSSAVACGSVV